MKSPTKILLFLGVLALAGFLRWQRNEAQRPDEAPSAPRAATLGEGGRPPQPSASSEAFAKRVEEELKAETRASGESAAAPSADPDPDCNLGIPLVPGIPGSPGNLIVSPRNPNGDSELAALMRACVDDLIAAKQALGSGQTPRPMRPTHRRMRCSWHTKEDTRNETFDGLARSYLGAVESFDERPSQEKYNAVVQGCVACHSVFCGGPLDLIEDLYWR
ncbi:MAG: hypothetical protein IPN34_19645 [Planctomycetes bacterium]|nr:hypothetical protein [Planctomycetota bacterium]